MKSAIFCLVVVLFLRGMGHGSYAGCPDALPTTKIPPPIPNNVRLYPERAVYCSGGALPGGEHGLSSMNIHGGTGLFDTLLLPSFSHLISLIGDLPTGGAFIDAPRAGGLYFSSGGTGTQTISGNILDSSIVAIGFSHLVITDNTITYTGQPGNDAAAVYISNPGKEITVLISGNTISATGENAKGILIEDSGTVNVTVTGNKLYSHDTSGSGTHGMHIESDGAVDARVSENNIVSLSDKAAADGIFFGSANSDIRATVTTNTLTVNANRGEAAAVHIDNSRGPGRIFCTVTGNRGYTSGLVKTLLLMLSVGAPGTGSRVDWSSNTVIPGPHGWTTIEPTRPGIEHNFNPSGDTLIP